MADQKWNQVPKVIPSVTTSKVPLAEAINNPSLVVKPRNPMRTAMPPQERLSNPAAPMVVVPDVTGPKEK